MAILPNELIIQIYDHLDYSEIIKSLHIFPFLKSIVIYKLKTENPALVLQKAIDGNNIYILDFLYVNNILDIHHAKSRLLDCAVINGETTIVQWLYTNNLISEHISYDIIMESVKKREEEISIFYNKVNKYLIENPQSSDN